MLSQICSHPSLSYPSSPEILSGSASSHSPCQPSMWISSLHQLSQLPPSLLYTLVYTLVLCIILSTFGIGIIPCPPQFTLGLVFLKYSSYCHSSVRNPVVSNCRTKSKLETEGCISRTSIIYLVSAYLYNHVSHYFNSN